MNRINAIWEVRLKTYITIQQQYRGGINFYFGFLNYI